MASVPVFFVQEVSSRLPAMATSIDRRKRLSHIVDRRKRLSQTRATGFTSIPQSHIILKRSGDGLEVGQRHAVADQTVIICIARLDQRVLRVYQFQDGRFASLVAQRVQP